MNAFVKITLKDGSLFLLRKDKIVSVLDKGADGITIRTVAPHFGTTAKGVSAPISFNDFAALLNEQ